MRRLLGIGFLIVMVGCGGGGNGGGSITRSVVGSWRTATIGTDAGVQVNCPGVLVQGGTIFDQCTAADAFTFSNGGTFTYTSGANTGSGTWTSAGNPPATISITITSQNGSAVNKTASGNLSWTSDTQLTFRQTNDPSRLGSYEVYNKL